MRAKNAALVDCPVGGTVGPAREGRLLGVLDNRLLAHPYLAGDEYTIADIACWPWVRNSHSFGFNMENFPNVQRWIAAIAERPAVRRGLKALEKAAA